MKRNLHSRCVSVACNHLLQLACAEEQRNRKSSKFSSALWDKPHCSLLLVVRNFAIQVDANKSRHRVSCTAKCIYDIRSQSQRVYRVHISRRDSLCGLSHLSTLTPQSIAISALNPREIIVNLRRFGTAPMPLIQGLTRIVTSLQAQHMKKDKYKMKIVSYGCTPAHIGHIVSATRCKGVLSSVCICICIDISDSICNGRSVLKEPRASSASCSSIHAPRPANQPYDARTSLRRAVSFSH